MAIHIMIAPVALNAPTNRNRYLPGTAEYWSYSALHIVRVIQYWRNKWLKHDRDNYLAAYAAGDIAETERWRKELQKSNQHILEMKKWVSERMRWAAEARV